MVGLILLLILNITFYTTQVYRHSEKETEFDNISRFFTNVNSITGVSNPKGKYSELFIYWLYGTGAAWADYDNDGDLDLYIINFERRNILYRNNGDGTFTDVTEEAGVGHNGMSLQPIWFDYNDDGLLDLFVATDFGISPLYRNNGDGTFTDVTEEAGLLKYGEGMGVDVGDFDNDGDLDIYVTNYDENYLWRNNGDGTFTDVAEELGVDDDNTGMGVHFFDFDNDGDLDLYITNGFMGESAKKSFKQKNVFYVNNGDGTFTELTEKAGLVNEAVGRGAAFGDYDNDGDVDIYVINVDSPSILYRNEVGNRSNWLIIRTVGTISNRDGIGAKVKVIAGNLIQIQTVISGSSYLCQNSLQLEFGLADHTMVDEIEIIWPSGIVQRLHDISANQIITIKEPQERLDACWLTHISSAAYKGGLDEWIESVPTNKIFVGL